MSPTQLKELKGTPVILQCTTEGRTLILNEVCLNGRMTLLDPGFKNREGTKLRSMAQTQNSCGLSLEGYFTATILRRPKIMLRKILPGTIRPQKALPSTTL